MSLLQRIPRSTLIYSAAIVVLLVVLLIQETAGRRPNTIPVPSPEAPITRVLLSGPDGQVELQQVAEAGEAGDPGRWQVAAPSDADDTASALPAGAAAIQDLLETITSLEEADVISGRENYAAFGLDEAAERSVRLFTDGREPLSVQLGTVASAGDAVYARINRSAEVVLLPRAISEAFTTERDEWRDREMLAIGEDEIVRVTITSPGRDELIVERAAGASGDSEIPNGDIAEEEASGSAELSWTTRGLAVEPGPTAYANLFAELAVLRAQSFLEEEPTAAPFAELVVARSGGDSERIALYPPDDARAFPVTLSGSPYPFTLPEWRIRRLLLGLERYLEPFDTDDTAG